MTDKRRKALGKGLSALLQDADTSDITSAAQRGGDKLVGSIASVPLSQIEENPYQPRLSFEEETLEELATSIRQLGIIQPITLRKVSSNRFQLISGERRFRASQLAGLKEIPAYIRIANDQEMLEMALVENIQREELDAIEIALSYQRLMDECKLTQETLSERVGKKRTTITNYLRLLKLPPLIQAGIRDGMIGMGHARALINIKDEDRQLELYTETVERGLSVREVEALAKEVKETKPGASRRSPDTLPEDYQKIQSELSSNLGTKTTLKRSANGKGKIIISFKSDDDLERILKHIS